MAGTSQSGSDGGRLRQGAAAAFTDARVGGAAASEKGLLDRRRDQYEIRSAPDEDEDLVVDDDDDDGPRRLYPSYGGGAGTGPTRYVPSRSDADCEYTPLLLEISYERRLLLPFTKRTRRDCRDVDEDGEEGRVPAVNVEMAGGPVDRNHLVYMVFFMLGLSTLLPWNFFISLSNFWNYKFRDVNGTRGPSWSPHFDPTTMTREDEDDEAATTKQTDLQQQFVSYLSIASNVPNAICVILNAVCGTRIGLRKRVTASAVAIILLFAVVTVLAKVDTDAWQDLYLYASLGLVVLVNVFTAVYQGAVMGVAGKFPQRYMGVSMAGQAVGGVFPTLINILVVSANVDIQDVGFACFLVATVVLFLSLLCFLWAFKSPFFQHYAKENSRVIPKVGQGLPGVDGDRDANQTAVAAVPSGVQGLQFCLRKSWQYCLSVFTVFCVSLALFPALTVLIVSEDPDSSWGRLYIVLVANFLVFNLGDLLGRFLANWAKWPPRTTCGKWFLILASVSRLAFVPLFLYCNTSPDNRTLPVAFPTDTAFIIIMSLFAVTNGYLGNICMLHGPKTVDQGELQEVTAMVLVAFLVVGIGVGSALSYPVLKLL